MTMYNEINKKILQLVKQFLKKGAHHVKFIL